MKKIYKFPAKIGQCADRLYELREKRLGGQKIVDEVKAEETALKMHIIDTLPKSEASGVAGKIARVSVIIKEIAQVNDWDKLYAHIEKTGNFDLLQRRVTDAAVKDRWEDGKEVPGVGHFNVVTVSLGKV